MIEIKKYNNTFRCGKYAGNVWDLQLFDNKIYIGQGDSAGNAGPVPVLSLDPATDAMNHEFVVDEEQIDIFKIIDGKLHIPGHDSREAWSLGNFYKKGIDSEWEKIRTIPNGIHVYDMLKFNGKLYASLGTRVRQGQSQIVESADDGLTWRAVYTCTNDDIIGHRIQNLFVAEGRLYGVGYIYNIKNNRYTDGYRLLRYDGNKFVNDIQSKLIIPKSDAFRFAKLSRITHVDNKVMYIAGSVYNDHQIKHSEMYIMGSPAWATKVQFANRQAIPTDILVRGQEVFVLAYVKISDTEYDNIIYKTNNFKYFDEFGRYKSTTFAMSFEEFDGDFFLGMGTYNLTGHPEAGQIVRLKV